MARLIPYQACSSYERISKNTVVAMSNIDKSTSSCQNCIRPKQNLINSLQNWQVTSFDSKNRIVCFDVFNPSTTCHMSITLPDMANKSWS